MGESLPQDVSDEQLVHNSTDAVHINAIILHI